MKEQILYKKNSYYENTCPYFSSIEKYLDFYLLKENYLILCFEDINLNDYKLVSVFFKNIKTREILKCVSKVEDNNLIIDLSSINNLCTNYEFSIVVILDDYNCSTAIYPKLRLNDNKKSTIISSSDTSNIQWFLRILDNGKLRLSTIYLFSNIEEAKNEFIL